MSIIGPSVHRDSDLPVHKRELEIGQREREGPEELDADITAVTPAPSEMIRLSAQKSGSSLQSLVQHLQQFHRKYTFNPSKSSFELSLIAPKRNEQSGMGGGMRPLFALGLLDIVQNSALRPAQFGASIGALSVLNSIVHNFHKTISNGGSEYDHTAIAQESKALEKLLRDVAQSAPITHQTCSSLLILELTILVAGLHAVPNPENKKDVVVGVAKAASGVVKSILELRLNRDVWAGLGQNSFV
jgi:hypothetical protein